MEIEYYVRDDSGNEVNIGETSSDCLPRVGDDVYVYDYTGVGVSKIRCPCRVVNSCLKLRVSVGETLTQTGQVILIRLPPRE